MLGFRIRDEERAFLRAEVQRHRRWLSRRLGRPVAWAVAVADYFNVVDPRMKEPVVAEASQLRWLHRNAVLDSLTGLYNRCAFDRVLGAELRRSLRHGFSCAVLTLDVDSFKWINDSFGHGVGDCALRHLALAIRRSMRDEDSAGRRGGDEFAVLLPNTATEGAAAVADRIMVCLEQPVPGQRFAIRVSGGVASFPADGISRDDLLSAADRALYRAKGDGRNGVAMSRVERRRDVRTPSRRPVLLRARGGAQFPAVLCDVCEGGVRLETPCRVLAGDELWLTLFEGEEPLTVRGRAAWAQEHAPPVGFSAGIAFEEAWPFTRER